MSSDGKDGVFLRVVAVAAACLCLAFGSVALAATYYVDSVNGNDDYDGTSPSTAWQSLEKVNGTTFQPGDQILLKADCVWTGQLWPKGSGAAGNPIMIDMYGTGAKPLINGDGLVQSTVYLYNQEYWEVSNLEITNWDPAGPDIRQGVYVVGHEYTPGVLNHIHLKDLVVHDVNGHDTDGRNLGKCNGGIIFDVWGCPISVRFNDVLVEGCYVYHVDRSGIKTWSDNTRWYEDPELPWYWQPYTNMVIRNNVLDDIGGDGIVTCHADAPLVEYNVASNCQARSNEFNVAIWPWDCDDALYQYNEAYLTHQTKDGQGYDIDGYNNRATLQYNYSHDNEGGFILICGYGAFNRDSVLRYNISEDDHIPNVGSILINGDVADAKIYNNVMWTPVGEGGNCVHMAGHRGIRPQNIQFYNNVLCHNGSTGSFFTSQGTSVWDYNVCYGEAANPPPDPHLLTVDPLFVNPGTGGIGRDTVEGYKLQAGSPCRDSGMEVPDNGGQDYWGNPVPTDVVTDRGAHEYQPGPQAPVAEFSANPTVGPAPLMVYFTDLSTGEPTSWDWSFGDDGTSQLQHPSHEYQNPGKYTVSLTAGNAYGSDTETKVDLITVISGEQACHVGAIDMADGGPPDYRADATVTVHDETCTALGGVTVGITWSGCVSGTDSGATDDTGKVTFTSAKNKIGGTFTCTVTSLTKSDYPYDPGANHETSDSISLP